MLKAFLILVIILLYGNSLGSLTNYWYTILPAIVGVALGFLWAHFIACFGGLERIHQQAGISPRVFTVISCVLGAIVLAGPGRAFLLALFPPSGDDRRNGH